MEQEIIENDDRYLDTIDQEIDALFGVPEGEFFNPDDYDEQGRYIPNFKKFVLPVDSELRKPWKEMNPIVALEEALTLPAPRVGYLNPAERAKGYTATNEQKHKDIIAEGWYRCPLCRNGTHRLKDGGFVICRCCHGFIYNTESYFMGFFASMNEIKEEQRILDQTKSIVKAKRAGRLTKKQKEEILIEEKKQEQLQETILFDDVKRSDLVKGKKSKETDHA